MNNFLQLLVDRSLGAETQQIRPRLPGLFEPITGAEPGLVELLPEQETKEEPRPRRLTPPVEAVRETAPPAATPLQPTLRAEEHPVALPLAPKPEPQISDRQAIEPPGAGQLKERAPAAQPAERDEPPQPEGWIESRPAPERPPDREPTPRHVPKPELLRPAPDRTVIRPQPEESRSALPNLPRDPKPELLRPAPDRAVVRPQSEESRSALLHLPPDHERHRVAPIEPVMRLRRDEPEIARDGGDIIPAAEPPASAPSTQSNRAPVEQPPIPRVQVSIGRVEVRAVFAPPPVTPPARPQPGPSMSLDDYLKQRDGGS